MIRGLAIITVVAAIISVLSFSVAGIRDPFNLHFGDVSDNVPDAPEASRTLPWNGGTQLSFNLPGEVIIIPGAKPGIVASGSKDSVDHLELVDNSVVMPERYSRRCSFHRHHTGLRIVVTAPDLNDVSMNGFGSLEFRDYQQKMLRVTLNGAGRIKGNGKVDALTVNISGAGSAEFKQMTVVDMDVSIDGAGSVEAGPTGIVHASIDGAGSVQLTTQPASLTKSISGFGSVSVTKGGKTTDPAPDEKNSEKI